MSLQATIENPDVGCQVATLLNLHNLCQLHMSSKALKSATRVVVARLDDKQQKIICNRTPFVTKKSLSAFLTKGPKWLNDFIDLVHSKIQNFEAKGEVDLRLQHAMAADYRKTAQKEKGKIRTAPEDLEQKIAKLRRTEAEKLEKSKQELRETEANIHRVDTKIEEMVQL